MVTVAVKHHTGKHRRLERSGATGCVRDGKAQHVHTGYTRSRRQGARKHPRSPEVTWDPGLGLTPVREPAAAAVSGAVREKWGHIDTSRLVPGNVWLSEDVTGSAGTLAEELPPPGSRAPGGREPARRTRCSQRSHRTQAPGAAQSPRGEGAAFSSPQQSESWTVAAPSTEKQPPSITQPGKGERGDRGWVPASLRPGAGAPCAGLPCL